MDGRLIIWPADQPLLSVAEINDYLDCHMEEGADGCLFPAMGSVESDEFARNRDGAGPAGDEGFISVPPERFAASPPDGVWTWDLNALRVALAEQQGKPGLDTVWALASRMIKSGYNVSAIVSDDDPADIQVKDMVTLSWAGRMIRERIIENWQMCGVMIHDPARVYIGPDVTLEPGVVLFPDVWLTGRTILGTGCRIMPQTFIENSLIHENVQVEYSVIRDSEIQAGTSVGPFAHIRAGSVIGKDNRIGNFVEVKKTTTDSETKAAHLAYLGDATLGRSVNIGAGTITCNYDGVAKHATIIEDGAFIGSDSILVAPRRIGKGAYVGAGSVITADVPDGSLAVGRSEQQNIEGWVAKRKDKLDRRTSQNGEKGKKTPGDI